MRFLRLAQKNAESDASSRDALYESEVARRIRLRYSVNAELAVLRQRDAKPDEFAEYDAYAELCKSEVREELEAILGGGGT